MVTYKGKAALVSDMLVVGNNVNGEGGNSATVQTRTGE